MKKKAFLAVFAVFMLALTACGQDAARQVVIKSNGTYINAQDYVSPSTTKRETSAELASSSQQAKQAAEGESTELAPSLPQIAQSADAEYGEVFWTEGGEVWHLTENCSSLSRSKNILSGSVEDAIGAGKERVCMRCGE